MLLARTVVLVSAVLEQPEQTKTCTIVSASSRDERDQIISLLQPGEVGGSRCSSDFLSRSTMVLPPVLNRQAVMGRSRGKAKSSFGGAIWAVVALGIAATRSCASRSRPDGLCGGELRGWRRVEAIWLPLAGALLPRKGVLQ